MGWFKKELKKEKFLALLTTEEKKFIEQQAELECTSQNSIVRKAISIYKKSIESIVKE